MILTCNIWKCDNKVSKKGELIFLTIVASNGTGPNNEWNGPNDRSRFIAA